MPRTPPHDDIVDAWTTLFDIKQKTKADYDTIADIIEIVIEMVDMNGPNRPGRTISTIQWLRREAIRQKVAVVDCILSLLGDEDRDPPSDPVPEPSR